MEIVGAAVELAAARLSHERLAVAVRTSIFRREDMIVGFAFADGFDGGQAVEVNSHFSMGSSYVANSNHARSAFRLCRTARTQEGRARTSISGEPSGRRSRLREQAQAL